MILFIGFYAVSLCLLPTIGSEYFPSIDGGELRLHVIAPAGTRVEQTERIFRRVEAAIRRTLPHGEVESVIDNIGLPCSGINFAYSDSQTIGESDGEILVSLNDHRQHSTQYYEQVVRKLMMKEFPNCVSYFQPADIVTQILNAGLPAPIAVLFIGMNRPGNYQAALDMARDMRAIPGAVDVCVHQMINGPHIKWNVDRVMASQIGATQQDVSDSFNISLASSFQTKPNFYFDKSNAITYNLAAQTPQYTIDSIESTAVTPVTKVGSNESNKAAQLILNLAKPQRLITPVVANHLNCLPLFEIFASCQGRDLGSVAKEVHKLAEKYKAKLTRGNMVFVAGEVKAMMQAFAALLFGLLFALALVYLLLVVNFQSWTDPLIILMAVPGAFTGIVWSLFITQTHFSIPALMGTIMTVGVASANSILMVTFAKEQLEEGNDAVTAAFNAGFQRFRPVIMTATAMIIGMIPMAIGGGEGSQNAPIGRAVIGGLLVATFSTLFFVPLFFSVLRRQKQAPVEGELHVDS